MLDRETWEFINTFAAWPAALATTAAVVTSLYLARKADRIRLELSVGVWRIAGGPDNGRDFVLVTVTNLARRQAMLSHLYWKCQPWKRGAVVWIAPQNPYSSPFPASLSDGQSATYASPLEEFERNFSAYAKAEFSGRLGWLKLQFACFCMATSTGHTFRTRFKKELRDTLARMVREGTSASA